MSEDADTLRAMNEIKPIRVRDDEASVTTTRPVIIPVSPFGKYTLIAKLGHGGMSEVFLSFFSGPAGFRKLVVIKRLHSHLEDEPQFVEMFLDEARLAARLNHPNVVQTYEVGEIDGQHFIAMEHLEGQALDRIWSRCISTGRKISPELAAYIVCQALEGLHYAHVHKDFDGMPLEIVHRDISPQNVFVTYEGQVKLLDFGIAKASTQVSVTRAGVVKGKYAYIAPEQVEGEDIDRRADLWSMGVVLWEMLCQRRLFKGKNDFATLKKAMAAKVPCLSDILPGIPEGLVETTEKALSPSPDERYQTAKEMKEQLESYLSTQTPSVNYAQISGFLRRVFSADIENYQAILECCIRECTEVSALIEARSSRGGMAVELTPVTGVHYVPPEASLSQSASFSTPGDDGVGARRSRQLPFIFMGIASVLIVLGFIYLDRTLVMQPSADGHASRLELTPAPLKMSPTEGSVGETKNSKEGQGQREEVRPANLALAVVADAGGPSDGDAAQVVATIVPMKDVSRRTTRNDARKSDNPGPKTLKKALRRGARRSKPPPQPRPQTEDGYLTLDTVPWSQVSIGGRILGNTPVIRVRLPVGTHVLTLRNPEVGISTTYRVTIASGEVTARRTALR